MKRTIIIGACMVLAAPAFAQSLGEKTGINSLTGASPTTEDFVKEAAVSDMFEIKSSQLAVEKSSGATKDFAKRMVTDHTKTSSELKNLVQSGKVKAQIPTGLDSAHQDMLDKLKDLSGSDFDKQYHSDQDDGHKSAVSLFERYSKGGDNAELKAWTSSTLPTLQEHYKMAEELDK